MAAVRIYYDELRETVINQEAKMSWTDLVSNIGGSLGLFLGMSFLSIVEFIELFIRTILIILKKDNKLFMPRITQIKPPSI